MKRNWFSSSPSDSGRSLDIVRIVVALILLIHPIYAFIHPGDIRGFGHFLESRGFPLGVGLAWMVMFLQVGSSLALMAGRLVVLGCMGHIFVLGMGIWLVHAPRWYTVGGAAEEGHPGAEFNVLLIACLLGVLWAHWHRVADGSSPGEHGDLAARRGLDIVRVAAALILSTHPLHGVFHPAGLRGFGHQFDSSGFHYGLQLVWTLMFFQIACSLAVVVRRFVVPACAGHIFVFCMGIWQAHWPLWFVVGPGEEGMEYSVLLIACFFSVLLAYWPRQHHCLDTFHTLEEIG